MRKIILNLCTSLDGYIEGAEGQIDWCFTDQDYGMTAFLERIDSIFIGRKSYEQLKEMAPDAFLDKKMIVFSRTYKEHLKDGQINDRISERVKEQKESEGKDIWLFGGAELIHELLELNLVDEMMIAVHPIILGQGKPLFKASNRRKYFKLKEVKSFSSGLVQQHYIKE